MCLAVLHLKNSHFLHLYFKFYQVDNRKICTIIKIFHINIIEELMSPYHRFMTVKLLKKNRENLKYFPTKTNMPIFEDLS